MTGLSLAAGNANCPDGGSQFTDGDGNVTYACNGAEGPKGDKGDPGPSIIFEGECVGGTCGVCDYSNKDPSASTTECYNDTEYARVEITSSTSARVIDCRASGVATVNWNYTGTASCGCGGGNHFVSGDIAESLNESFGFPYAPSYYFSEGVDTKAPPSGLANCGEIILDPSTDYHAHWETHRTFVLPANTAGTYRLRLRQRGSTLQAGFNCNVDQGDFTVSHDVSFYCVALDPL